MKRLTINSEGDVHLLATRLDFHVFRGQKQDWPVQSRLARVLQSLGCESENWKNRENNIIREFASRIHLYEHSPIDQADKLGCCSLMQHYGAPTRLIDFTASFYVALFFAVEDVEYTGDSVVWCLNEMKIRDKAIPRESVSAPDGNERQYQYDEMRKQATGVLASDSQPEGGLLLIEPAQKNQRLSRQQGCFLFPKQIDQDLSGILASDFSCDASENDCSVSDFTGANHDKVALKVIIPSKLRRDLLPGMLWRMNINHEVLFPGIDGFCKSMTHYCGHAG